MLFPKQKSDRTRLFEKAMLGRKEKITRRSPVKSGVSLALWGSILLWASFLLVGGYIFLFSPALMIREVRIDGESVIPPAEYQLVVEEILGESYLGVFSKRNYFLIPAGAIAERIRMRFPKVSAVSFERQFPSQMTMRLQEDPALLLWCSGGPCYSLRDERAIVLPFVDDVRYAEVRLTVTDTSALPVTVGEVLPVQSYLDMFFQLREGLRVITEGVSSQNAATPSRHSGELHLMTGEGWKLLASVERPVEETLGTLELFFREYAKEHEGRDTLESVDLRVAGKIFYTDLAKPTTEMVTEDKASPEPKTESKKPKRKPSQDD